MSNISRRDFMKTAGVMTLAVAASGVLAGCSTDAAEETKPTAAGTLTVGDWTVTVSDVKLYDFINKKKGEAGSDDLKVGADAHTRCMLIVVDAKATKDDPKAIDLSKIKVSAKKVTAPSTITLNKKAFSFTNEKVATATAFGESTTSLTGATAFTTSSSTKYVLATTVDSYGYTANDVYKTPSVTFYTRDDDDVEITGSISVTVPAAETIYSDSKVIDSIS